MSIARRSVGWLAALPLLGISSALSPIHANQSRVEAALSNIITLQRPGQDGLATIWEKNKYVQCWLQPDRALRCEAGGTLMQPSLVRILSPERIARLIYDYASQQSLPVVRVTVWETPTSFAEYRGP